ncbi:hypothetical protein QFC21_006635 [Naganishia friedmannii]|uniref:Uncharacterized protein n=1 Tax=Naganishia friedmannii TaxID=89922 RepID=A0ACC2V1G1_9TREE|nr:hypothetical protein QFC21_006635 [Naganishia friedmannii]
MVHTSSEPAGGSASAGATNQTIPHTENTVSVSPSNHVEGNPSVDPKERGGTEIMKLGLESQTLEVNAIHSQSRSNIDPDIGKQAMAFREKVVAALPSGFRAAPASWGATSLYQCICALRHRADGAGAKSDAHNEVTTAIYLSYQSNAHNLEHALETEAAKYKVVMYICPVEHVIKGKLVLRDPESSIGISKEVVVGKLTQGTAEDSIDE